MSLQMFVLIAAIVATFVYVCNSIAIMCYTLQEELY